MSLKSALLSVFLKEVFFSGRAKKTRQGISPLPRSLPFWKPQNVKTAEFPVDRTMRPIIATYTLPRTTMLFKVVRFFILSSMFVFDVYRYVFALYVPAFFRNPRK